MPGHVSSSTLAAYEGHHVVNDDLWVQIVADDDPYFWHRQQQRAHWQMPLGTRPGWVRSRDGLFVRVDSGKVLPSLSGRFDLYSGGAGKVWTVYELKCFLSSLVIDVVLPVLMQRQALAVLFVRTVEVPQFQFFDVVGFQFWACGCALTSR